MTNIKKILITISIFLLGFGQVANAGWEPTKEVEIVAHAKETSSTVAFARAVIKVIEEEKLLNFNTFTDKLSNIAKEKNTTIVFGSFYFVHSIMQHLQPLQLYRAFSSLPRFCI